jgi:hypothetical protein
MKINLHIERLVLDGLPLNDAAAVAQLRAGLEAELARLIVAAAPGLPPTGGAVPRLQAAPIHLSPAAKPARLGQQIAQAVHGALNK